MKTLVTIMVVSTILVGSMRVRRQADDSDQRLEETPPQVCCLCIEDGATCNNNIGTNTTNPGINCDSLECELFNDCNPAGCKVQGLTIVDTSELVDLRQKDEPRCPPGQKICCNPGPGGGFEKELLPFIDDSDNTLVDVDIFVDTQAICESPKLVAVQDFGKGVVCGKRDSRVYYDAGLEESYTSPGEWPWVVLIFHDGDYIGAGMSLDNNVVVTVGHKVKDFVSDPSGLTVRLGDWNPNTFDKKEEIPHIEVAVVCVKVHPDADLSGSLENNVAVLKLNTETTIKPTENENPFTPTEKNNVLDVIDIRKAPRRPGNRPKGIAGSSVVEGVSSLDVALGLVSDPPGSVFDLRESETPRSYFNTVCLPNSEEQFKNHRENCWVAAWGNDLKRQREVDLPLVSRAECQERLAPIFREKNVPDWKLKDSEICAGGVPGKDACTGEGGAPLVCYDKRSDQYFALGLVNYGFGCNTDKPAVYTNLADKFVKLFITSAIDNDNFC